MMTRAVRLCKMDGAREAADGLTSEGEDGPHHSIQADSLHSLKNGCVYARTGSVCSTD